MSIQEQIISDKAMRIYEDIIHKIKPLSAQSSIRWLKLALKWAICNKCLRLACEIEGYLAALNALSETMSFEENSILAIGVA